VLLLLGAMGGCATQRVAEVAPTTELQGPAWSAQVLPGKRETRYEVAHRGGRRCLLAQADKSASLWRRRLKVDAASLDKIEFDWWLGTAEPQATVTSPEADDAPARLVLAFDGDSGRLSPRNRLMFELMETLTGEPPPFATLMYVWDGQAAAETVVVNAHSDRVRKIVLGSGADQHGRWQRFARDVRADYRRAYGEEPGALIGVALMTDADNTRGRSEACYGMLKMNGMAQSAWTD
jgi:hypothetical protein